MQIAKSGDSLKIRSLLSWATRENICLIAISPLKFRCPVVQSGIVCERMITLFVDIMFPLHSDNHISSHIRLI